MGSKHHSFSCSATPTPSLAPYKRTSPGYNSTSKKKQPLLHIHAGTHTDACMGIRITFSTSPKRSEIGYGSLEAFADVSVCRPAQCCPLSKYNDQATPGSHFLPTYPVSTKTVCHLKDREPSSVMPVCSYQHGAR